MLCTLWLAVLTNCPLAVTHDLMSSTCCCPQPAGCCCLTCCPPVRLTWAGQVPPATSSIPIPQPGYHRNHGNQPSYGHHGNAQRCSGWRCSGTGGSGKGAASPLVAQGPEHNPHPGKTNKTRASITAEMQKHHVSSSWPLCDTVFCQKW